MAAATSFHLTSPQVPSLQSIRHPTTWNYPPTFNKVLPSILQTTLFQPRGLTNARSGHVLMTRRKRAYVPKTKGCYECSQRRIHCDRTQPQCAKCLARGLACSGLGIRYRFNHDVIRRATRDGEAAPWEQDDAGESSSAVPGSSGSTTASDHASGADPNGGRSNLLTRDGELELSLVTADDDEDRLALESDDVEDIVLAEAPAEDALAMVPFKPFRNWEEYLLAYFSTMIAPEMVPVDDQRNGWRHLILPLAHTDQLIRDAVLSASAFHFSATVAPQFAPAAIYHRAIRRLRARQDLPNYDLAEKQIVILALLVFLATVLVSGSSDYRIVLRLLDAAVKAAGGDDALAGGELGLFIVRQIHKFRGYASPLLGQAEGLAILSQTSATIRPSSSRGWDDFTSYYEFYTNHQRSMSLVYDLHEQACNIYVQRVRAGPDGAALTAEVDNFRQTLDKFPPGSAAENILVWPIFLAALESTTPEARQYFINHLLAHHKRNGFANILTALGHLNQAWAQQKQISWTELLPNMQAFIV